MEGGRIVQCGTPRDILPRPATPYVAEFVAHMNPLGVLRARDVMAPIETPADPDRIVAPETPLRETLALFAAADAPVWAAAGGEVVGAITPDAVFRVLAPRGGPSPAPSSRPEVSFRCSPS